MELSPASRQVAAALADAGLVVDIRRFPEGTPTAADAATALGCELGQIVKSLVFTRNEVPVLVLCGGDGRVDARRLGLARASPEEVRLATGFSVGGVPPLGHARRLETLIDPELLSWPLLWAGAGTVDTMFAITPADLVRATAGEVTAVR